MDALAASLIELQSMLARSLVPLTGLGVVLIGFGLILSAAAPAFGYRVKRLGLQMVGACLVMVITHTVLIELYGAEMPVWVLVALYALIALLLLQGFLNLVFGRAVGDRVISDLIGHLVLALARLALKPFRTLRGLFR